MSELAGGAPVLVPMAFNGADSQWDAAWLAAAEAAWEDVPVEAKRQCLGNVLFAIAARFPDVGYCQVSVSWSLTGCDGSTEVSNSGVVSLPRVCPQRRHVHACRVTESESDTCRPTPVAELLAPRPFL